MFNFTVNVEMKMKYFFTLFVLLFHVHYENENFKDIKKMIRGKKKPKTKQF